MTIELSKNVINAIANEVVKKMQEPCEDAVSRSEALKKFTYNHKGERIPDYDCDNFPTQIDIKTVKEILRDLPSVHPKRKTRKWIEKCIDGCVPSYHCSECNKCEFITSNFCPNCGADMESEDVNND